MSKQLTNFKTIQKLSEGTFDNNASFEQLEALRTFNAKVYDLDIEFPAVDFKSSLIDNEIAFTCDLGSDAKGNELILDMNDKALGDIFSKSATNIGVGDFRKLGLLTDLNDPNISVGRILMENAKGNPRGKEGHTAIVYDDKIRGFVSRNYPTVAKSGIDMSGIVAGVLEILPKMTDIRHLPEGFEDSSENPLFECKFNKDTGSTHGKIVYDILPSDHLGIETGKPFAFGMDFSDNLYGSGKQIVSAFSLNIACMNGNVAREGLAGIVANHTSVENMVKSYLNVLSPTWGFGGSHPEQVIIGGSQLEITAIMTRLQLIAVDPKKALFKGKKRLPIVDSEYIELFNNMLALSLIKYADFRRTIEMEVIRGSTAIEVKDILKELEKLKDKKHLSMAELLTAQSILEEDSTIPVELKNTAYGLSSAITRLANNFQASDDSKYNKLQTLGRNIMEVLPTVNYGKNSSQKGTY